MEFEYYANKPRIRLRHHTRCAQCGFEILPSEETLLVCVTGDIIHRECWCDYAEDNMSDLTNNYAKEDD